jgi:hypothetical protein
VPIIGGGGIIAIVTAYIGKTPEPTKTPPPAAQLQSQPVQPALQPAKRLFTFRIRYETELDDPQHPAESPFFANNINVFIDDVLVKKIEDEARFTRWSGDTYVSTLGKHRFNITGTIGKVKAYSANIIESSTAVGGEGTIYVQDGSEFRLVVDRNAPRRPHKAIMKLVRAN